MLSRNSRSVNHNIATNNSNFATAIDRLEGGGIPQLTASELLTHCLGFEVAWNLAEPTSSSGYPFPLTLPSPRRRGRNIRRAMTNWGAWTFPATGRAPSPLGHCR